MIRHISVFFVREDKKSQIEDLVRQTRIWSEQAGAKAWTVGASCMPPPEKVMPGMPMFGDFAQVLDFEDADMAAAYPHHPAHKALMESIGAAIENVVAIDFEM